MRSSLGWVAIDIATVIANLLAQRTPLVRRHALPRLTALWIALLPALLLIALNMLAALLLAFRPALFNIAATALATLRSMGALPSLTAWPAMARLRPHRLRGSEQTEAENQGRAFHDGQLTTWRNRS